jgi:hypothetical protein
VTRRQELVLAGVAALVVLAVGVMLVVRPVQQATAEARAERETAVTESQSLRDQIKALEALEPKEAELRTRAEQARAEFPATPALPGLVDALQEAASLSGIDLGSVAPSPPTASTSNPQLAEISTDLSVSGGYFEIQDFLVRLENLVKGADPGRVPPRSMLVQSVNLSSGSEGAGTATGDAAAPAQDDSASPDELQGKIVLLVFQLAQPGGAPSAAPGAPAASATPGVEVR